MSDLYHKKLSVFNEFPILSLDNGFYLRKPSQNDAVEFLANYNHPAIKRFVQDDCVPKTIEDAKRDLDYLASQFDYKNNISWVIARCDTDELVGTIGFHDWDSYHNRNEIAYELHPNYWGKGIMTAALMAVMQFAFETMGVNRVQATTVTYNNKSISLLLKCGFILEGVLRQYKVYNGQSVDIVMFGYSSSKYFADLNSKSGSLYINSQNDAAKVFSIYNTDPTKYAGKDPYTDLYKKGLKRIV